MTEEFFKALDIISFSTLSLDMIEKIQIGGPPCYGSSCLEAYEWDVGLQYFQVVNLHFHYDLIQLLLLMRVQL